MGIPVSKLKDELSSAELALYMAYDRIDPFGEERADLRNALSLRQHAEMNRDRQKHPAPFEIADFMPFDRSRKQQPKGDSSEIRNTIRNLAGRKR